MIRVELSEIAVDALHGQVLGEPLNGDDVWYQYHTQHDARVRPSHAALDGTVWRADDPNAPTPPIAYGCRCFLTMVARPGSAAAKAIPESPAGPTTIVAAFSAHLEEILPEWRAIAAHVDKMPLVDRASSAFAGVTAVAPMLPAVEAREIARMIVTIVNDGGLR